LQSIGSSRKSSATNSSFIRRCERQAFLQQGASQLAAHFFSLQQVSLLQLASQQPAAHLAMQHLSAEQSPQVFCEQAEPTSRATAQQPRQASFESLVRRAFMSSLLFCN